MNILIGAGNPAKFSRYRAILAQFPHLNAVGLADVPPGAPVIEDGATAESNARKKARAYAVVSGLPTLSVDEALTLPELPAAEQPGTHVRRYQGREATDEDLLAIYLERARRLAPHERAAIWVYAICLAFPDGREYCGQVELHKRLADRPSLPMVPGYPLSSLLVDLGTGKAIRDLTPDEERQHLQPVYEAVAGIIRAAGLAHPQEAA